MNLHSTQVCHGIALGNDHFPEGGREKGGSYAPPHPPTPSYILLLVRVLPIFSSQVWQIANSACVKHLKRDCYTEVTGILHIHEQARFLSGGVGQEDHRIQGQPQREPRKCMRSYKG